MWPAAAAAESMKGYMAIEEADILVVGEEKAEVPVIDELCANAEELDDIMWLWCWCEKLELVPVPDDKFELFDDKDELDAMDGDGEQPVGPELAFQHIII